MDAMSGKSAGAGNCARIVRVGAVARDSLDIDLSNGSILLLSVELILSLPGFGVLADDDRVYYPKTDGSSVYWQDGPRHLTVEEILGLAGKPSGSGSG
jgi:hypothetical protein